MDAYIGTIMAFGGDYAPLDWLFCYGQQLRINEYQALHSLIGKTYGGDGATYFNLPDLRERVMVGYGQGPGLTLREMGEKGGAKDVVITENQMPSHTHMIAVSDAPGTQKTPSINCTLSGVNDTVVSLYDSFVDTVNPPNLQALDNVSMTKAGGGDSHPNVQQYQELNYIICYNGIYPNFLQ